MHKLGDQWIEVINGEEHMVEAVEGVLCTGCMFGGMSLFGDDSKRDFHLCSFDGKCPVGAGNRHNLQNPDVIIKDLGILNEDGCLPTPWDKELYPDFYNASKTLWCIHAESNDLEMKAVGNSKQEAIDAWNRRE